MNDPSSASETRLAEIRTALHSAGVNVWEWDLDTDRMSEGDTGLSQIGFAPGERGWTQAEWSLRIHPDDRPGYDTNFERYRRGDTDRWECVYRILDKDGCWRHFEERGRFVDWHADGRPRRMVGTQADVTEREQLRAHAAGATRRLTDWANHVPGMLFQFQRDADGHSWFPVASDRCRELLGLTPQALRADAAVMLRLIRRDERQQMLDSIAESARTLRPWRLLFRIDVLGHHRWLRGTASPESLSGGVTLWSGYVEDVTETLSLEQAQRDKEAAESASRAKSVFLSRISHELRTPLNAVLGFAQLMAIDSADPPSAGQQERLRLIVDSGHHLLSMIGDLLDLSRAEAQALALQLAAVPIQPLMRRCLDMLQPMAESAAVTLQLEPDAPPDATVMADATRLRQVLLNLLGNAIKYNRPGGQVSLSAVIEGEDVCMSVVDNGVGIEVAEQQRIFEPFYRGFGAQAHSDGSGIGLSVTRSLVHAMGGRIHVDSTPGLGSTFRVWLPAATAA